MPGPNTLRFTGTLTSVVNKAPTLTRPANYFGGTPVERMRGGSVILTLEIPRPELPDAPAKPYDLDRSPPSPPSGERPGRWRKPDRRDGESDKGYKSRSAQAHQAHDKLLDRWRSYDDTMRRREEIQAKYEADLAAYQQRAERLAARFEAYARLAGVGAVLNGLQVAVTLRPLPGDLTRHLPGFSPAQLLLAGGDQDGADGGG